MKVRPHSSFRRCRCFLRFLNCHDNVSMSYQLLANLSNFYHIFWLSDMAIFSRVLPPDNFEPHNFRKLSIIKVFRIKGVRYNFVGCQSFSQRKSPDRLDLWEINDSSKFYMRGYLPLIQKHFGTHLHDLVLYVRKGLPFARDLSPENSKRSDVFYWLYLIQCLTPFWA